MEIIHTYERLAAGQNLFNHFSAGFPLATVPPNDSFFALGIEHMWSGVDACLDQAIDRNNPDYAA